MASAAHRRFGVCIHKKHVFRLHMAQIRENNKHVVNAALLLRASKHLTRMYRLLHCDKNSCLRSDEPTIVKKRSEYDLGVQTMAQPKRRGFQ